MTTPESPSTHDRQPERGPDGHPNRQPDRRPGRRRQAFLWAVFLLLSAGIAMAVWIGSRGPYREACRRLAAQVRSRGGITDTEPVGPAWLADAVGRDYLRNTVGVTLPARGDDAFLHEYVVPVSTLRRLWVGGPGVTDDAVEHLLAHGRVEVLILRKTRLSDRGAEHLAELQPLRHLDLSHTRVTDRGLRHLAGLPKLEVLVLDGTDVTDAGIESLRRNDTGLATLSLANTKLTDAGAEHLADFARLEELTLSGTALGDAAVQALATLGRLRSLRLAGTRLTDAGIAKLGSLGRLEVLDLRGTAVTDAGLTALEELPGLRYLWLADTAVTEAAIARYAEAHPKVWIDRCQPQPQETEEEPAQEPGDQSSLRSISRLSWMSNSSGVVSGSPYFSSMALMSGGYSNRPSVMASQRSVSSGW